MDFINKSGMGIANRGLDAMTEIESINSQLEQEVKRGVPGAALKSIENLNKLYLKVFLQNADVLVARASWITYYEMGLKKQGIKGKFDYSKDEINQEAANFAQQMLDRQQNVSDKDLAGSLYDGGNSWKNFIAFSKALIADLLFPFLPKSSACSRRDQA